MCEILKIMPAVTLRGMVILPGMVIHFDISKKVSIHAVEEAMKNDEKVFLVTLKNNEVDEPLSALACRRSSAVRIIIWFRCCAMTKKRRARFCRRH